MTQAAPPPGWFADYADPTQLRYWDGTAWTGHTPALPSITGPDPGAASTVAPIELSGERRRVYGNDMLYVTAALGVKVGRINLVTGKVTMDLPDHRGDFDDFVARWRDQHGVAIDPAPKVTLANSPATDAANEPAATDPSPADAEEWADLAQNRAGAAVREKALELRAEAPVKTFVARVFGVHTDERAFRTGANGEEEVGYQLSKLGDDWRVLHSVPVGENDSDIDHVVIGPPGVFTLNTKHHPGAKVWVGGNTFIVNGNRYPYVRNSRFEARRSAKLLTAACGFGVHAEPIIVVMAGELTIKNPPDDVHVVGRRRIARWLRQQPQRLTADQVAAIYEPARRDTTWTRR